MADPKGRVLCDPIHQWSFYWPESRSDIELKEALGVYELPIQVHKTADGESCYSIKPAAALLYLSPVLRSSDGSPPVSVEQADHDPSKASPDSGSCQTGGEQVSSIFWRLPAELRTAIYEFVFQYPASGLLFQNNKPGFRTATRELNEAIDFDGWGGIWGQSHLMHTISSPEILAPLLVSKRFRQEALPLFFSLNKFDSFGRWTSSRS
jgi:hypothetical protein